LPGTRHKAWLRRAWIDYGAVFRRVTAAGTLEDRLSPQGVWKILRRRAKLTADSPARLLDLWGRGGHAGASSQIGRRGRSEAHRPGLDSASFLEVAAFHDTECVPQPPGYPKFQG
jgi:hypothetical protein